MSEPRPMDNYDLTNESDDGISRVVVTIRYYPCGDKALALLKENEAEALAVEHVVDMTLINLARSSKDQVRLILDDSKMPLEALIDKATQLGIWVPKP